MVFVNGRKDVLLQYQEYLPLGSNLPKVLGSVDVTGSNPLVTRVRGEGGSEHTVRRCRVSVEFWSHCSPHVGRDFQSL